MKKCKLYFKIKNVKYDDYDYPIIYLSVEEVKYNINWHCLRFNMSRYGIYKQYRLPSELGLYT
jgi:hypothetical protein